jgi:hypothetical protein
MNMRGVAGSSRSVPRNGGLLLAFVGLGLLVIATLAAYRLPVPRPSDAPFDEISAARIRSTLSSLSGADRPHPLGSAEDALVRRSITDRLQALGYATTLQTRLTCRYGTCGTPTNIIASREPRAEAGGAVLLAAHYDSVAAGPGASDDGAGVATLLEIARIMASRPPARHPLLLLFSDGEEAGLLGAQAFVETHPLARRIQSAVNLEARGTSGSSLMFETGTANAWLMDLYARSIARPITNSLFYTVYKLLPNDTDFTPFKNAGYQGYNFAFIGHVGFYHTALDDLAHASPSTLQQQGDDALGAVSALMRGPAPSTAPAEDVFFDVLGRALVRWPAAATLPLAALVAILLCVELAALMRARLLSIRALLVGAVGALSALALSTALSAGVLAGMISVGKVPSLRAASWIAHPAAMHLAAAALPLWLMALASGYLRRRAGFWGFWAAASLFCALLAIVVAALAPGASFVLLLAGAGAVLGAAPATFWAVRLLPLRTWMMDAAALLPVLLFFAMVLPMLNFLYTALGSPAWPISTLALGICAMSLAPLMAVASRGARRLMVWFSAIGVIAGAGLTLVSPTYSAEWPERVNVEYWLEADSGEAHYFVTCDSMHLPAPLAAKAQFDPVAHPRFAGSRTRGFIAPAPAVTLAAPELTIESATPLARSESGKRVHYELNLRSARGAAVATLVFPPGAGVHEARVAWGDGSAQARLYTLPSGATLLQLVGLPPSGAELGIDADEPAAVQIYDETRSLVDGETIARARPPVTTSSQDGDLTVVHRTVALAPGAGR